ncbi:metal-sulfur cluster assembly factor [Flavihumibacter solisilvae]|uniref:metal-sulfur cluster assembly factor n=1 Tax=Flavihumibacter solisilvae TaxID=1349421 RepID=UPI00068E979F|nr:metal-sulfur cluster assembly factor [Flavihumibacter solisilvae]
MNVITNNSILCTVALAALQNVVDPELGLNVVDLGLIYQVDFDDPGKTIYLTMTLTTRFCPMGESLAAAVTRALQSTFPHDDVSVLLTFDPPWDHTRISAEGKMFLNK